MNEKACLTPAQENELLARIERHQEVVAPFREQAGREQCAACGRLADTSTSCQARAFCATLRELRAVLSEYRHRRNTPPATPTLEGLGEHLVHARIFLRVEQSVVAFALGVSVERVNFWEQECYRECTSEQLTAVAKALGYRPMVVFEQLVPTLGPLARMRGWVQTKARSLAANPPWRRIINALADGELK